MTRLTMGTHPLGETGPTVADLIACASNVGLDAQLDGGKLVLAGEAISPKALDEKIRIECQAAHIEVGECTHDDAWALTPGGRPVCTRCGHEPEELT